MSALSGAGVSAADAPPVVGSAPARRWRFDPPSVLLLALSGGGWLPGWPRAFGRRRGGRPPSGRVRRRVLRPGRVRTLGSPARASTRAVAVRRSRSTPASSSATAVSQPVGVARVRCLPVRAQLCVHDLVELGARLFGAVVRRVGVAFGVADLVRVRVGVGDRASDVGVDRVFDAASVQPHHLRRRAPRGRWPGRARRGASVAANAVSSVLASRTCRRCWPSRPAPSRTTSAARCACASSWCHAPQTRVWRSAVLGREGGVEVDDLLACVEPAAPGVDLVAAAGALGRACSGRGSRRPAGGRRVHRPGVGVARGGRPAGSRPSTGRRGPRSRGRVGGWVP